MHFTVHQHSLLALLRTGTRVVSPASVDIRRPSRQAVAWGIPGRTCISKATVEALVRKGAARVVKTGDGEELRLS